VYWSHIGKHSDIQGKVLQSWFESANPTKFSMNTANVYGKYIIIMFADCHHVCLVFFFSEFQIITSFHFDFTRFSMNYFPWYLQLCSVYVKNGPPTKNINPIVTGWDRKSRQLVVLRALRMQVEKKKKKKRGWTDAGCSSSFVWGMTSTHYNSGLISFCWSTAKVLIKASGAILAKLSLALPVKRKTHTYSRVNAQLGVQRLYSSLIVTAKPICTAVDNLMYGVQLTNWHCYNSSISMDFPPPPPFFILHWNGWTCI